MDILPRPSLGLSYALTPKFRYDRFANEATDIRLLKIEASANDDLLAPIRLQLYHTDIQRAHAYISLSYTWGRPASSCPASWDDHNYEYPLFVNGRSFAVRANLYHALLELRRQSPESPFWIDAICIDQSHVPEKNQQVQRMGEIYRKSQIAIIWLGPADDDTQSAYFWMEYIANAWREYDAKRDPVKWEAQTDLYAEFAQQEFSQRNACDDWRAVQTVLTRAWFKRAWIAQELCLAPRAVVKCGHRTITWTDIADVGKMMILHATQLETLPDRQKEAKLLRDIQDATVTFYHLTSLLQQHDRWSVEGMAPPLCIVLDGLRYADCTNPRDMVYAGLGLSHKGVGINVDYDKALTSVFLDALNYSEKPDSSVDMRFISYTQYPPLRTDMPSWLPDWSLREQKAWPLPKKGINSFMNPNLGDLFSAGGSANKDNPPYIVFSEDAVALVLPGGLWDEVAFVSSRIKTTTTRPGVADSRAEGSTKVAVTIDATWLHEWALDSQKRSDGFEHIDPEVWTYNPTLGPE